MFSTGRGDTVRRFLECVRVKGDATLEDSRKDYGEPRFQALGFIGKRLHALVFTPRTGQVHVISLRKANRREVKRYETQTQS